MVTELKRSRQTRWLIRKQTPRSHGWQVVGYVNARTRDQAIRKAANRMRNKIAILQAIKVEDTQDA